jgi:hypothetical protein
VTYWLEVRNDKVQNQWLAMPFDFIWNFPIVAARMWRRRDYWR